MVQSKATSVEAYLAELPEDRRAALQAVRDVILENLDDEFEEGMQYGMIGYYVPHRVYPHGYHCDPKQPLPFANLGSQKNHMALYMMCLYSNANQLKRFESDWKKTGKKLDMGKSCIRFKKIEDLALSVIGETIRQTTARKYIETCEQALASRQKPAKKAPAKKAVPARKPAKVAKTKGATASLKPRR
jgi:Domain of unknown function (DU1801)